MFKWVEVESIQVELIDLQANVALKEQVGEPITFWIQTVPKTVFLLSQKWRSTSWQCLALRTTVNQPSQPWTLSRPSTVLGSPMTTCTSVGELHRLRFCKGSNYWQDKVGLISLIEWERKREEEGNIKVTYHWVTFLGKCIHSYFHNYWTQLFHGKCALTVGYFYF